MAQIGTVKVETPSGIVEVPVFESGDSGASVYEMVRVNTPSGVGFIPAIDTTESPSFPYLKVNTSNNGILAFHDSATIGGAGGSAIEVTSTLNGDTVLMTIYEDIDGNGTVDNQQQFTLTGGTETLSASNFDLSAGNDVWWDIESTDDGDVTDGSQIDSVSIGE